MQQINDERLILGSAVPKQTRDEPAFAGMTRAAFPTGVLLRGETDPTGKSQKEPGAKVDAGKVRMHLITGGMARAITEVAKVGTMGAAKYTDGGWVSVPDGFRRYEDAQQRHAAYRHMGEEFDPESHLPHLAHEAWNALAKLDLYIREREAREKLLKMPAAA